MSRCIRRPYKHQSKRDGRERGAWSNDLEHYRRLKAVSLKTNRSERSDPGGQISSRQTVTCCQIVREIQRRDY